MEDLRSHWAQTHFVCCLKYAIIHIKNLDDENFSEFDILQHCLVSPII